MSKGFIWSDTPRGRKLKQRAIRASLKDRGRSVTPSVLYQWLTGIRVIPEEVVDDLLALAGMTREVWDHGVDGKGWVPAEPGFLESSLRGKV
jgi:hypothetical protein